MTETTAGIVYLAVSTVNALVQTVSLRYVSRRHGSTPPSRPYRALVRTASCRVLAACLYVGVGVVSFTAPSILAPLALAIFSFTQILWQANAVADMALRRRLADTPAPPERPDTGRHSTPDRGTP